MEDRIIRSLVVLGVPGVALGVFYLLLRTMNFKFAPIGPTASTLVTLVLILVVGGITLYALQKWAPTHTQAKAETDAAPVRAIETPGESDAADQFVQQHQAPRVENAPGLVWTRTGDNWAARWRARDAAIERGWKIKSVQLWSGRQPDEFERGYIGDRCRTLQKEMQEWLETERRKNRPQ
jgi:hypothetical protein